MRLPSSFAKAPPPPRLRVPMQKPLDEKMGQVQDDQSRTSDEEDFTLTTSSHAVLRNSSTCTLHHSHEDSRAVGRSDRMRMKHERKFNASQNNMINEESSVLMDSSSSTTPAVGDQRKFYYNNSTNPIRKNNGYGTTGRVKDEQNVSAERIKMIQNEDSLVNNEDTDISSHSNSQIHSSAFLRKLKRRTLWWGNRNSGYLNFYNIAMCLLLWLVTCDNGITRTMAITSSSGIKSLSGIDGHRLVERSAAIVKLEPDYQPIIFPKKESTIEDNHLHTQTFSEQPENSHDRLNNAAKAEAYTRPEEDEDRNSEEYILNPTNLPETSKSTIIFRGVRNRTRVEVGPVSLFSTKRKDASGKNLAPGSNRQGRVMFAKSEPLSEREENVSTTSGNIKDRKLDTSLGSSEEGSSRKASPDVQDIIDGIVKLLGGKVHNQQPGAVPSAIAPKVPFSQRQPQTPAYNLFNPNKPVYQTAKPSRINSRGPPLGATAQNGNTQTQQQTPSQQQSSFEAIPLEALNSDFKLNQTRFGPPFPLSQVPVSPEAPYQQGIPLPEQLVPPPNGNKNFNNGNVNVRPPLPPPTAPASYVTTVPNANNPTNIYNANRPSNGFYANGNNRYVGGGNAPTQQRPSSVAPVPSSLPPTSYNQNGNTGLTTVSTSLTTTSNKDLHYYHHQTDKFNENGTRPVVSDSTYHVGDNTRKPASSVSSDEHQDNDNTALTSIPSAGQESNVATENNRPFSSPRPPPLSLTLPTGPEDDEADDLRFTTNVDFELGGSTGVKWNDNSAHSSKPPGSSTPQTLEPTITDDSQLPPWSSSDSGRLGSNKETIYEFSEMAQSSRPTLPTNDQGLYIRPTSVNSLYPTLVLETNSENGLVELVTKLGVPSGGAVQHPQQVVPVAPTSTSPTWFHGGSSEVVSPPPAKHQTPHPDSNLRKQVQHFNNMKHSTRPSTTSEAGFPTQSIHSLPTPPLRPGIVINDGPPNANDGKGYGSVEVVTVDETGGSGKVGEIFDITVTAKQNFGGKVTGRPFHVSDPNKDDIVITQPTGTEQFVSIDGKRTYFNLHPNTPTAIGSGGVTKAVGHVLPVENTDVVSVDVAKPPGGIRSTPASTSSYKPQANQNIGVGTVGNPVPLLPQPPGKTLFGINPGSNSAPNRAVSTSLSISGSGGMSIAGSPGSNGGKQLPNLIRRPHTRRPSVPPVRIDTCIVGDDTTCNVEQGEVCRTESGVSSCVCRSGYARRRHREPCKAIVSLVLSIKLDKLGDKKLTYNPDYFNPNSELYQTLEWETIHAMDSAMGETTLSTGYVGSKLEAIGFDGRHAVVNTTVLIQENVKQSPSQVKRDLQKQMIQVLTRNRNNFGKSQLWVEGPISAVSAISDFDECENPETNDCDLKAKCVNTLGSFECKCEPGYGDPFEKDKRRSGRKCETCNGKTFCNGRGDCLIENGQKVCRCAGNYYGSQCDIDGEVLAVAIGASVSAVVIISLTLACLCMWSRKWKREEQKAALMSRTVFGGMATQALSYLGKNSTNPYQQHLSMDDRLRWAQCNEASMGGNIYVQNEPMSMHTSPQLIGTSMMETPPLMSARRSADTVDTTVDDLFEERQTKRPRSRASQMQGSLYYDLEPEPKSDIYASRSMMQYPAQFCVPMGPMSHYAPPSRGYFP